MKPRSELYLKDILTAINKIQKYRASLDFTGFKNNDLVIDAVTRQLEIIGEAVSQLSTDIKTQHPEIPWTDIKSFRNVVVHKYWIVDAEILWDIIKNKLDNLYEEIRRISEKN